MKKLTCYAITGLVSLAISSIAIADEVTVNSSLPPMSSTNTSVGTDPCLNNPNVYVQQSCEQARQAAQRNAATAVGTTSQNPTGLPAIPAWQQALDQNANKANAANNPINGTMGASSNTNQNSYNK